MESRSLVPQASGSFKLPIANLRNVFRPDDVERKLAKLPGRDHENLRATYERMLERGPERFQVKPSGLPEMAPLYEQLPNFADALDDVKRHVALSQNATDGIEITPMLLLGAPGIGKTHFARQLADLLGTGMSLVPMSSMTAGWLLSGASSQWKGAKPGKVFDAIVEGQYANPVIVVDEIDKAAADAQYDPLGALYGLLEHDTAESFMDEFAEVAIDASQVIWIMTANTRRSTPEPILNRMNVFEIEAPSLEAARQIARNLYRSIRGEHGWGSRFAPEPRDDVLDLLAELAPREMRRALMTGFGNARLDQRSEIAVDDLARAGAGKGKMGFINEAGRRVCPVRRAGLPRPSADPGRRPPTDAPQPARHRRTAVARGCRFSG